MKTSSWEIILTGLLFIGIAIYIVGKPSKPEAPKRTAFTTDSIRINIDGEKLHVVELKKLEKLESLENLESLKNITNFLPMEVQGEIEAEINKALKELEQEGVNVEVNHEKGIVSINKEVETNPGNWTVVSPGVFAYVQEFDASDLTDVDIALPFGSIEVKGGSGQQAKLTIQASGQVDSKSDLQSKISTSADLNAQKATFSVNSLLDRSVKNNIHLEAVLLIPENIRLHSITKAGHITSENIHGIQVYETQGGHIKLKNVSENIEAKTSGGHITVSDSEGKLNLHSLGGHIQTTNISGVLSMTTSGGNLSAHNLMGSVRAKTNGGNIEFRFLEVQNSASATTGAGTITLMVPTSTDARFILNGNDVSVAPDLNFKGNVSAGSATGKMGDGNASITASTRYGKVILKSAN